MELIKIFCMTKDEYDLIESFILYYGHLFGFNNLIIIDNMSTNNTVLNIYKKYIEKGITLYYESDYTKGSQGNIFTKYMNKYKDTCKYMMGLDTDEFIFSLTNPENPCDKNNIINIINTIPNNVTKIAYGTYVNSIVDKSDKLYMNYKYENPVKDIIYFNHINWRNKICVRKVFYESRTFISTENGNHDGIVSDGKHDSIYIGILHYHETGARRKFERCMNMMNDYKYSNTTDDISIQYNTLINIHNNNGIHIHIQYIIFLLRKIIINMFEKYVKRIPPINEFNCHIENKFVSKLSYEQIENEFKNCIESKNNQSINNFVITDDEKNYYIFNENDSNDSDNKHIYTFLSDKIKLLYFFIDNMYKNLDQIVYNDVLYYIHLYNSRFMLPIAIYNDKYIECCTDNFIFKKHDYHSNIYEFISFAENIKNNIIDSKNCVTIYDKCFLLITSFSIGTSHGYAELYSLLIKYLELYDKNENKIIVYKNSQKGILEIIYHIFDEKNIIMIEQNITYKFSDIIIIPFEYVNFETEFTDTLNPFINKYIIKHDFNMYFEKVAIIKTHKDDKDSISPDRSFNFNAINNYCKNNNIYLIDYNILTEIDTANIINKCRTLYLSWGTTHYKFYPYISELCETINIYVLWTSNYRDEYIDRKNNNLLFTQYKNAKFIHYFYDENLKIMEI